MLPAARNLVIPAGGILNAGQGRGTPAWLAAANPAIGQYVVVPNTKLSSCPPSITSSLIHGNTGPSAKMSAYCGAAFSQLTGSYTLTACGGHNDYGGSEANDICFYDDWPGWVEWCAPTVDAYIIRDVSYYLNLQASAKHTYSLSHWVDSIGKCLVMPFGGYSLGAPYPTGWPYANLLWMTSFDRATKTYDDPTTLSIFPGTGDPTNCLCVQDPVTELIYYSPNYGIGFFEYNPVTKAWRKISNLAAQPWYTSSAVDHARGRILTVGGFTPYPPSLVDFTNGTAVAANMTGPNAANWTVGGNQPAVIYDQVNDCYLMFINEGGNIECYRCNAATMYADKPTLTGVKPLSRRGNDGAEVGIYNSIRYIRNIGGMSGIVGANSYTNDMFFLRLS